MKKILFDEKSLEAANQPQMIDAKIEQHEVNPIISNNNSVLKELLLEGTIKEKFLDLNAAEQAQFILKFNKGLDDYSVVELPKLADMKNPDPEVLSKNCIWPYREDTFKELSELMVDDNIANVSRSLIFVQESVEATSGKPILKTHELTLFSKSRGGDKSLTQKKNDNTVNLSYRINRMIYKNVPEETIRGKKTSWVNTGSIYINHSGILPNSPGAKVAIKRMKDEFLTNFHRGTFILEEKPDQIALTGMYALMNWLGTVIKTNVKLYNFTQLETALDELLNS